ncbi:hypothetical protein KC349_g2827 [Hortaea werneckii]|nr:hypothetical protein KC349_g2827 [Hortaea werneckii]
MVYKPTSNVSFAKTCLPYPIFSADWDPYNRGYLVVGGGGGESKTGVPNQITVLDTSNRATITTAAEIQLSRDEDSVQSLGNLATKDGLITFAGINSSQAQQNAGVNEHLRSFDVKYPPRKKQKTEKADDNEQGEILLIGQRSLFKPSPATKKETYQRLLRLSPAKKRDSGSKRLGAVATGMAEENEVIVFNATNATPDKEDIVTRIQLPQGTEANDLDIIEPRASEFSMVYCIDSDIYEQSYEYDFSTKKVEKTPNGPRRVYQSAILSPAEKSSARSKFRCVRFLNSENVVAIVNRPFRQGCELRVSHLYPTGPAAQLLQFDLPRRMKQAVSMDVCALDPDMRGNQQFVIAIAGSDVSIEIYTTNYMQKSGTFTPFKKYLTLRDVHEHQMTKICFSPFHPPQRASEGAKSEAQNGSGSPGPQYIRLASVTYGNTVVVDTFPLQPLEPKKKNSRYVLSHPGDEKFYTAAYIFLISAIVVIAAYLIQGFVTGFTQKGTVESSSGPSQRMRNPRSQQASGVSASKEQPTVKASESVKSDIPSNMPGQSRLQQLLSQHDPSSKQALVVREEADSTEGHSTLSVKMHADKDNYLEKDVHAKYWTELTSEQQTIWKERLIRAGEWAEGQGEKVLIGILFSEYAGLVGQAARGALNQ